MTLPQQQHFVVTDGYDFINVCMCARPVCEVLRLDASTSEARKISAFETRRTVLDWLELCKLSGLFSYQHFAFNKWHLW
jgi:hypothetical protein